MFSVLQYLSVVSFFIFVMPGDLNKMCLDLQYFETMHSVIKYYGIQDIIIMVWVFFILVIPVLVS